MASLPPLRVRGFGQEGHWQGTPGMDFAHTTTKKRGCRRSGGGIADMDVPITAVSRRRHRPLVVMAPHADAAHEVSPLALVVR